MTREEQRSIAARKYADDVYADEQTPETIEDFWAGAAWADSHPHWIPVEEELPPENGKTQQSVSVWATNGLMSGEFRYNFDTKTWTDIWGDPFDITHWMPLPQLPRKEDKMKARIKTTGKEIIVEQYGDEFAQILPDGDYKVYTKQELVFPNETGWQQVRIQFVGQIASAIMSNYEFYAQGIEEECKRSGKSYTEIVVQMSLETADALIAELKRSYDAHAECRRMDAINTASVCENMTKIQKELKKKGGKDE